MGLERVRLRHHACHHSALCRIPTSPAIVGRTYEAQCPTLNMLWHSPPANVAEKRLVPTVPTPGTLPRSHLQGHEPSCGMDSVLGKENSVSSVCHSFIC